MASPPSRLKPPSRPNQAPPPRPASPGPGDKDESALEKRRRMRSKVAHEILESERSYVKSLETLFEVFSNPLNALAKKGEVVSQDDVSILFSNLPGILQLNAKFLSSLEQRIKNWSDETCLADKFLEFTPFFKMYTQYVTNHDKALHLLEVLHAKPAFQTFLKQCDEDPRCAKKSLNSFLITPIQRIPRYELLLKELLKQTPENHPDYAKLTEALTRITETAEYVNESLKQLQIQNEMLKIQKSFAGSPPLIAPGRRFIYQGQLTLKAHDGDKKMEFFLFNDLFAYAHKNLIGSYQLKFQVSLAKGFRIVPEGDLMLKVENPVASFVVEAPDAKTSQQWLDRLSLAIAESRNAQNKSATRRRSTKYQAAPVWQSDASSAACSLCSKPFTFMRRRHHCRSCGAVVCDPCSSRRLMIASQSHSQPQRVCDTCVDKEAKKLIATGALPPSAAAGLRERALSGEEGSKSGGASDPLRIPHAASSIGSPSSVGVDPLRSGGPDPLRSGGDPPARKAVAEKPVDKQGGAHLAPSASTISPAVSPAILSASPLAQALLDGKDDEFFPHSPPLVPGSMIDGQQAAKWWNQVEVRDRVDSQLNDEQISQLNELSDEEADVADAADDGLGGAFSGFYYNSDAPGGGGDGVFRNDAKFAIAQWDFDSGDKEDLHFKQGEIIKLHEAKESGNWWKGEIFKKQPPHVGSFPKQYVRLATEEEEKKLLAGQLAAEALGNPDAPASLGLRNSVGGVSASASTISNSSTSSASDGLMPDEYGVDDELRQKNNEAKAEIARLKDVIASKEKKEAEYQQLLAQGDKSEREKMLQAQLEARDTEFAQLKEKFHVIQTEHEEFKKKIAGLEEELTDASRRERGLLEELEELEKERTSRVDRILKIAEAKQEAELKAKAMLEKLYDGLTGSLKELREGMRHYEGAAVQNSAVVAAAAAAASAMPRSSSESPKKALFPAAAAGDSKADAPVIVTESSLPPAKVAALAAQGILDPSELPRSASLIQPAAAKGGILKKRDPAFLRDAEKLARGTLMTKIPRWGKHKKSVFCLKKIKQKEMKGSSGDLQVPAGKSGQRGSSIWRSPPSSSPPAAASPQAGGPARAASPGPGAAPGGPPRPSSPSPGNRPPSPTKDAAEDWVYCLEWLSKGQKARLALTSDLQVQFGQNGGQFRHAVNKKQYVDQAKMSFTIICPDRTVDMVCEKMEDFQCWQNVLRYLLTERIEQ